MQTRMLYPRTFIITREEDTYVNATTCLPASTLGSAIAVLDEMLETVRHVGMGSSFAARGEWGAPLRPEENGSAHKRVGFGPAGGRSRRCRRGRGVEGSDANCRALDRALPHSVHPSTPTQPIIRAAHPTHPPPRLAATRASPRWGPAAHWTASCLRRADHTCSSSPHPRRR